MLYVFQVDTGQMLNFEMDVAISTVQTLKSKILSVQDIPLDKQVLLVSGGEILEGSSRVCNYAAGTDTNPIFLFNKANLDIGEIVSNMAAAGSDVNLTEHTKELETIQRKIQDVSNLPPTYMSVVSRAQLAQHIDDLGKELFRKCEVLIHHQHLQHQGWGAVLANLDDIVGLFNSKMGAFAAAHEGFFGEFSKETVDSYVDGLDSTLKTLAAIKLPEYYYSKEQQQDEQKAPQQSIVEWLSEHFPSSPSSPNPPSSSSSPLHAHLHSVANSTKVTHDHLSAPNFVESLRQEASAVLDKGVEIGMKEIKGLEERLYGLDQLLAEANKIVVDQHELTLAFHQNVSRASDVRDSSIFPDLCASHQHQLVVMFRNHGQLEDIRRRCEKAKGELTQNLNTRLRWIAFVQKNLSDIGGKISVFHESLKRLRVHVNVLQQVSCCEAVFSEYVTEAGVRGRVGRRLKGLARKIGLFNSIAEEESRRRVRFRESFGGHFLSQAFAVLVEDREVKGVGAPSLVDYLTLDDGEDEQDEDTCCDHFTSEDLKLKQLQSTADSLKSANSSLEERVKSLESQLDVERLGLKHLQSTLIDCRMKGRLEGERAERLAAQVDDLKRLIDEFRVKEEEVIRVHGEEVGGYERRLREVEGRCDERVSELGKVLEFEWGQKVKAAEEAHKLEYDAMVKRFKLVNKSVFGGSSERIGPILSPVSKRFAGEGSSIVEQPHHHHHRRTVMLTPQHMLFSDEDEEEEEEDDEEDSGMIVDGMRRGGGDGGGGGSLERGVEAAVAFLEEEDGRGKEAAAAAAADDDVVVVPQRVISTADRLHKLSRISISTCRVGSEPNLFYWNEKFNSFTVYLNNRNVHFLNTSGGQTQSPCDRGAVSSSSSRHHISPPLTAPGGASSCSASSQANVIRSLSKAQMFVASITDKEFCVARRAQNRYNVPQGFHFYRVRCTVKEVIMEE